MYIVGDASGVEVEVRFGKRGYQAWNATFNVNAVGGTYVSIPFSAFEDAGGGDGILDLSGITRLWFFFKGNRSATLYIDDITVGSNENYTVDTRSEIEKATIATIGTYGDFESYTDSAALNAEWVSENATVTLATTGAYGGSKAAAIVPSSGWATFGKDMPYTDFSNVVSITFKASAGLYVLQVISDYNVIETTIRANANGEVVGANLADLQPQSSAHTYKLDQINCVRIGIKDQSGSTVMIDDISLNDVEYVAVDHSAKVGTYDDFESYASATEMSAVWTTEGMSSVTLASTGAFGGSKAATLVPTAGWATFAISLPDMDFSAITSITFKASAGTYVVQMLSGWNVIEKENIVAVQDGDTIGVNLADLVARSGSEYKLTEITSIVIGIYNSHVPRNRRSDRKRRGRDRYGRDGQTASRRDINRRTCTLCPKTRVRYLSDGGYGRRMGRGRGRKAWFRFCRNDDARLYAGYERNGDTRPRISCPLEKTSEKRGVDCGGGRLGGGTAPRGFASRPVCRRDRYGYHQT